MFEFEARATNDYVLAVLDKVGLTGDLVEVGHQVAAMMTEMFADLPPEHPFFEQFSFISADDLPEFAAILGAYDSAGATGLRQEQRQEAKVGYRSSWSPRATASMCWTSGLRND